MRKKYVKILSFVYVRLLLLASVCISMNKGKAQHGVSPDWGNEITLPNPLNSTTVRGFLYSNMVVLSNNKRVIFINKTDNPSGIYYTYSYDGINWATPQLFSPVQVVGLNSPKIAADTSDNIHVVWAAQQPKALFYTQMDSALNVIIDSVRIADSPAYNTFNGVYLSVDLKKRIHVMWHEGNTQTPGDVPECYYSKSVNGGISWLPKNRLSNNDGLKSAFPRGQFNAYDGDTLAIAWRDSVSGNDWDIQMVLSYDAGNSWTAPVTVNASSNFQGDPDLVIDNRRRIHLFYHEAPLLALYWGIRIVYGYSDDWGQTWLPSANFYQNPVSLNQRSYLAEGSRYDIANNVLWTFWKEEDLPGLKGGDMMAAYSTDRGVTWSSPEYITDKDTVSIGFKSVALLQDGRVAVNFELPQYPSPGEMRVIYKERQTNITGIMKEKATEDDVVVYPNPAHHVIRIVAPKKDIETVEIFSLLGKKMTTVYKGNIIDIRHLPQGTYLVKVKQKSSVKIIKIIKI